MAAPTNAAFVKKDRPCEEQAKLPGFSGILSHARQANGRSNTVLACFGVVLVQRLKA
jgi:hypothetical protein